MPVRAVVVVGLVSLLIAGCTLRYSQSITGNIPNTQGTRVQSSDSGFSLFNIAISEPQPAHEQVKSLLGACSALTKVQVDYRETVFLILGIPKIKVTATCVR